MQWTYDPRGLDMLAWLRRATDELACQRAAGGTVTILVGDAPVADVEALRQALAASGDAPEVQSVAGVRALVLGPAGDAAP